MTSASTKRRHRRNAELFAEWAEIPIGTRVTVQRARGDALKTTLLTRAQLVGGSAMIMVAGIPGYTRLDRVTLGWNPEAEPYSDAPLPWNHRAEKEIQRLRVAMVQAMDDCDTALHSKTLRGVALDAVKNAHTALKSALERK